MTAEHDGDGLKRDEVDSSTTEADLLRATERERLRALVAADLGVAERLHAEDFELITPSGAVYSKEQYLGAIASGQIDYLAWEPDSPIVVRIYGPVALLRYRSRLDLAGSGHSGGIGHYWHTDLYEQRDGRWQVVWSQATEVQ